MMKRWTDLKILEHSKALYFCTVISPKQFRTNILHVRLATKCTAAVLREKKNN